MEPLAGEAISPVGGLHHFRALILDVRRESLSGWPSKSSVTGCPEIGREN